ncbi:MAG: hypothetical protein UT69_C0018G0015, partial [Candidatus Yanofskybacteria bacterium GW2011_GWE1_40_10]
ERRHVDQPQLVVAVELAQLVFDQADSLVASLQLAAEGHRGRPAGRHPGGYPV